jgi:hypothetical protein
MRAVAEVLNEVLAEDAIDYAIVIYLLRKMNSYYEGFGIERKPSHG